MPHLLLGAIDGVEIWQLRREDMMTWSAVGKI
jgi:hypothetical protein